MQETLSVNGALLTKIFGRQAYEYGRFNETNRDVRDLTFRRKAPKRLPPVLSQPQLPSKAGRGTASGGGDGNSQLRNAARR